MKHIRKQDGVPGCITEFIEAQLQARIGDPDGSFMLDYRSFDGTPTLREILSNEQGGICAYTGVGIDSRLASRRPRNLAPPRLDYWYNPHIEHLKPQAQCRRELEAAGSTPGVDLGEDLDYHNMVAALEVRGTSAEQFGAVVRGERAIDVWPTHADCELRFKFDENGGITGVDAGSRRTIAALKLDHKTLCDWRQGALDAFLDPEVVRTRSDLEELVERVDSVRNGILVEFCFVIRSVALAILGTRW